MCPGTRFATTVLSLLTLEAVSAAEPVLPIPRQASIVIVPSRFDAFLIQTGDVRVTFSDGRDELLTHSGDCHDAKVSPKGNVGWVRVDKKSVDVERMRITGRDTLVIRLLDGRFKEFPPFDENVCIMDWRFADADAAVVVRSMGYHGPSSYVKYEVTTGRVLGSRGPSYTPYDELPSWAKPLADPKND
jgi:hypothetical protein